MLKGLFKKNFLLMLTFLFASIFTVGQSARKTAMATRVQEPPVIDGKLESCWYQSPACTEFRQYDPVHGAEPMHKTDVYILYDNQAVYIGAVLFDSAPDSILKQLGNRDEDLNADKFGVEFDTYNNKNDAYVFEVTASGVQTDYRENDDTYNAVWESKVCINDQGWCVEMKIPYSALRFPKTNVQSWGLEIYRNIRRNREQDYWALEEKGIMNSHVYWGELQGIENIEAPLRLSFTPYVSYAMVNDNSIDDKKERWSSSLNGGLDLKYGINEAYTLDMTLLPDFSQVQSDNKVKNLSAYETTYDEQRPFFNEATDLFEKGNLFYSRRIGKTPSQYDLDDIIDSSETVVRNPLQSKLLNATKVSGRGSNGLAFGMLNALTGNTYATVRDSMGNERKILTEPWANYNILVFDQVFKNNSSAYFSNANVSRSSKNMSSNVSSAGIKLRNNKNIYYFNASFNYSQFYYGGNNPEQEEPDHAGSLYSLSAGKGSGNVQFYVNHSIADEYYNANDAGITLVNNYINNNAGLWYHIYKPFGKFRNLHAGFDLVNNYHYQSKNLTSLALSFNINTTNLKYLTLWSGFNSDLSDGHDYYEPRIDGKYFVTPRNFGTWFGFSSDYRKTFALDGDIDFFYAPSPGAVYRSFSLNPIVRASDKFSFDYDISCNYNTNELGFACLDETENYSVFGQRDISTITNTFNAKYMFANDLSVKIRIRHYWSMGEYKQYYLLQENGSLLEFPGYVDYNSNFNFNAFNIDFSFNWQFAPGSSVYLVWKNEIFNESDVISSSYFDHLTGTFENPQVNTLSLKVLYYIDYIYLKKRV